MRSHRTLALAFGVTVTLAGLGLGLTTRAVVKEPPVRDSRLFRVDHKAHRIVGPATHVPRYLGLKLVSVTMDQPQYWANEKVRVKVVMPGQPKAHVTLAYQKRDAAPREVGPRQLDENGVAVVEIMDGAARRLELGEYRVDVKTTSDTKTAGSATYAVVEGSLGSIALAYEFKQVTSAEELDKVRGGWFLGNPGRAGQRWGNGLSFKNELRWNNRPYEGPLTIASRCMLPGCNGVDAGPRLKLEVKKGVIAGTMSIGGHSGPFQIELITPKGSLRHQFEGSSHVERDMVPIAKGVGVLHRAGLAPYGGTKQVPGRQIFIESKPAPAGDAFAVTSAVAEGGNITIRVEKAVTGAAVHVWAPLKDGTFEQRAVPTGAKLAAGQVVKVPVAQPFGLVTVGGFAGGKLVEGYVVAFPPAELKVTVEAPREGAPQRTIPVVVAVVGEGGRPARVSGILEAFDNRVASRSPASPLASAIGDSVRNVSNSLSAWVDPIEAAKEQERAERQERVRIAREKREEQKNRPRRAARPDAVAQYQDGPLAPPAPPSPSAVGLGGPGRGGGYGYALKRAQVMVAGRPMGQRAPAGAMGTPDDESEEGEVLREGEQKVVFCERVQTDASGRAVVQVKLPPQTGRTTFRFVAFRGFDHATAQAQVDVTKRAYVEARLPQSFVPGTRLDLRVMAVNTGTEPLTLQISGAGIAGTQTARVAPGQRDLTFTWQAVSEGQVSVLLADARGKVVDRREMKVRDIVNQPVTYSRLELAGDAPVRLAAGESAVVYQGPGHLLKGMVLNVVTTMYSWFGHAEALSAQVAVRATVLAAISRGLVADDGLEQTLRVDLDKAVRDLAERFWDRASGLMRPFPGLDPNPLWTAWASRNLHAAVRALKAEPRLAAKLGDAIRSADTMARGMDAALKGRGLKPAELGLYDPSQDGQAVIPVEIDGQVVYRVVTDDAVQRFALERLAPLLDPDQKDAELAFGRAYDTFRFLRAFKRTGSLQYQMEIAKALWLAGPKGRAQFQRVFRVVAKGMIAAQEPGLIQGPALLGGVYSTPMAVVRFFELMLLMGPGQAAAQPVVVSGAHGARQVAFGDRVDARERLTLKAGAGAVVRIDRGGRISLLEGGGVPFAAAHITHRDLVVSQEAALTIQLDAARDPLEYYAIIAVPTTTAVKQTEDILSDYKGQLLYGQQSMGGAKMQVLAVPFRGSRTMRLLLEGVYPGVSDGLVAIRHMSNPAELCHVRVQGVSVREAGARPAGVIAK
ncbi:MAG TPA: alpha-2-macroglobulin family protein [Polyangia bacterium]|jgi:hypothetical protein